MNIRFYMLFFRIIKSTVATSTLPSNSTPSLLPILPLFPLLYNPYNLTGLYTTNSETGKITGNRSYNGKWIKVLL